MDVVVIGYVVYAALKFAGYTAFCRYLHRRRKDGRSSIASGALRTLIGMIVGGALFVAAQKFDTQSSLPLYFGVLIPVRCAEWWLLGILRFRKLTFSEIIGGILVSFALDAVVAGAGFLIIASLGGLRGMIC
jgi:hypothetical protein